MAGILGSFLAPWSWSKLTRTQCVGLRHPHSCWLSSVLTLRSHTPPGFRDPPQGHDRALFLQVQEDSAHCFKLCALGNDLQTLHEGPRQWPHTQLFLPTPSPISVLLHPEGSIVHGVKSPLPEGLDFTTRESAGVTLEFHLLHTVSKHSGDTGSRKHESHPKLCITSFLFGLV